MKFASTFAGIGGFDLGFHKAGMTCTFQSEINPHRQRVLARHWPDVPQGGDIRDISGSDIGSPDLLAAGFPCKNLSIGKGHRRGLDSDDSGLYWEFHRLVGEHLRLVDAARPRWTVLENVPGLLSFNGGRDMALVLMGLEELGYGWAYRVVDCRSVGSAQRRPRVVIVGVRGGDPRAAQSVLADYGTGELSADVRWEPARDERPDLRVATDGSRLFRKRANPRKKASEGGWASYEAGTYFNTLTNNDSGSNLRQKHVVFQQGRLRALTPVEWERLQGFPDTWTEGVPDRERFLALGDAMNVNLAEWLGRRLMHVEKTVPALTV